MEFLAYFIIHFFGMGIFVLLISITVCLCFDHTRKNYIALIGLSMLAGYIYTLMRDITELALLAVLSNGLLTVISIVIIKFISHFKTKDKPVSN